MLFEKGFIFGIEAIDDVLEFPQSLELNILDIFLVVLMKQYDTI